MNPLVQSTAKHLSRVAMTQTPINSVYASHPDIRDALLGVMGDMEAIGMPVFLVEVVRTPESQDEKYAQGRDSNGNILDENKIITYAHGLESPHQFGLAADFMFSGYNYGNRPPSETMWVTLGGKITARGLVWGGNWPRFKDRPHAEHPQFDANKLALKEFFTK